mgnify:CR=1 FL=1
MATNVAVKPHNKALELMAQRYTIDVDKLYQVLKATCIKGTKSREATWEEAAAFVMVANRYDLDPFTRQIHAFCRQEGGVVPIVGIDGWATIVNSHKDFDGCKFEVENDAEGKLVSTTCLMFAKGRGHPVEVTEWLVECKRPSVPWTTMPRRMLRHKAFMQAARLCFGLGGIYDEDEAKDIIRNLGQEPEHEQLPVGRVSHRVVAPAPIQAQPVQDGNGEPAAVEVPEPPQSYDEPGEESSMPSEDPDIVRQAVEEYNREIDAAKGNAKSLTLVLKNIMAEWADLGQENAEVLAARVGRELEAAKGIVAHFFELEAAKGGKK